MPSGALGKKVINITSKHGTTIFFFSLQEKRLNTERVYQIVLMPSGHPIILLKSN